MDVIATHANAYFNTLPSMVAARKLFSEAKLVLSVGGQQTVSDFLVAHDLSFSKLPK